MKKSFDCIQMKRDAQEQIYQETRHLDREAEIAYFHEAGLRFWQEIETLRSRAATAMPRKKRKTG